MQIELSFAAIQSLMLAEVRGFLNQFDNLLLYGRLEMNGERVYFGETPRDIARSGFTYLAARISSASNLTDLNAITGDMWHMSIQEWVESYFRSLDFGDK